MFSICGGMDGVIVGTVTDPTTIRFCAVTVIIGGVIRFDGTDNDIIGILIDSKKHNEGRNNGCKSQGRI